jgi:circadian clock protein KaiC
VNSELERAGTGIAGLDLILGGGFPRGLTYLIEGDPGTGKTTMGLQFLLEGARQGEPGLYVSLSSPRSELEQIIRAHGWSPEGVTICDVGASEESLRTDRQYTVFHPSEIELSETTRAILQAVEQARPARVVFDALSEMKMLARDPLRFRRQIWELKDYFSSRGCTVLLLDYRTDPDSDLQLHSLSSGAIRLEQLAPEYGGQRRRLRVQKLRAVSFRDGYHDYTIQTGGMAVFPRLVAAEHHRNGSGAVLKSGLAKLDALLGGGLDLGTSTMVMGPVGVGKTSLALHLAAAAAREGKRVEFYLFDEAASICIQRGDRLGLGISDHIAAGRLHIRQVDPAELSPGELAWSVRTAVEQHGARVVVIDSLNGYQHAMPEEHHLTAHLHELLAYLTQQDVLSLLILGQHGIVGHVQSPIDPSYLADNIVLMRFVEAAGELKKAISVIKKRSGPHETTIRELQIDTNGLCVGEELHMLQGVLTGQPVFTGVADTLPREGHAARQP